MQEVIAKIYELNNIDDMPQYPKRHITPPPFEKVCTHAHCARAHAHARKATKVGFMIWCRTCEVKSP